jgi:mono/diheme cytochrome c family protein
MYQNILLTHKIVVIVFLLHYVLKLAMLLLNRKDQLAKYAKLTRIPEMILSVLFLITGIWMLVQISSADKLMLIKLACVFASIPLAIIGFKRSNKVLAALAVFLLVMAYGFAEMHKKSETGGKVDTTSATDPIAVGKMVYQNSCINCHGADGKLSLAGAKDLSVTNLTIEEQEARVNNGKGAMPAYKSTLTPEQIKGVVEYIGTLRQK